MEQFGALHYAVLCKAGQDMRVESLDAPQTHKGTAFVRFKRPEDAKSLLDLSREMESQMDLN